MFVINALEHGGAAKVTALISNGLVDRNHEVFIMTNCIYQKIRYKLDSRIILLPLIPKNYFAYPRKIRRIYYYFSIRKNIKNVKPDIIIGMMENNYLLAKLFALGLSIPIIASHHSCFYRDNDSWYKRFIHFFIYPFADAVTILSKCDCDFLGKRLPKKEVLPNPVEFELSSNKKVRRKTVLVAGRLSAWKIKGFDTIIETWSRIAKKYPQWTLEIAGDGNSESMSFLQTLASMHDVAESVVFLGFCNMVEIYQSSSIFVLSSRFEGMPLVLMEAMSQSCACVAFELDGRTNEIISSPDCGIVVENQNKDELEKAIVRLIEDEALRDALGKGAKREMARFSKEKITELWESLFAKVINQKIVL